MNNCPGFAFSMVVHMVLHHSHNVTVTIVYNKVCTSTAATRFLLRNSYFAASYQVVAPYHAMLQ